MDTEFLNSFVQVVKLGSLAAAARELGVTPAAIAQRIRALEGELGASLISRSGRAVRPTEAGFAILTRGRAFLRDLEELRALATGDLPVGHLRLGAVSTALTGMVPAMFRQLFHDAPLADFYVAPGTSVDLYRRVAEGELDAAILVKPYFALPKTFLWHQLRVERLIVLASARFDGQEAHGLLRGEPFIRYDRAHWGGKLADSYLQKVGIFPSERLELDALEAIAVMVDADLGVSLVPDWAPPWPAGINIVKLALPEPSQVREIGLLWLRGSPRSRLIRAVLKAATSR